jgi:SNF2 family DNA or RNA helicase
MEYQKEGNKMPIQIGVKNKEIFLNIYGKTSRFTDIIQTLKSFHCTYEPEDKLWKISPNRYDELYEVLSDIDRIFVMEKSEKEIEDILHSPTQIKIDTSETVNAEDLKMPPIVGKPPYENFQLEDIRSCYSRNRFALYLEQGSGKSYIVISTIELLRKRKNVKKVLFLTSASGVYNIKKEFERFSNIPSDKIALGGVKNRTPFDDPNIDIILCNYRSFLLISDEYQKEKKSSSKNYRKCPIPIEEWLHGDKGILVLDESHMISNPKARQTKVIHLIASYFEYRYILTGTPADKTEKFYSQLKILDPALVRNQSYYEWLAEYANLGNRFTPYAITSWKASKTEELSNIVKSICVRRFANDILSLPEHFIRRYYVEFTPLQKDIYQSLVLGKMHDIEEEYGALNSRAVIGAFQYLILAIDNPKLLLNHEEKLRNPNLVKNIDLFKFTEHSKMEALMDILEKHENEKTVIWTSHPSVGNELLLLLKDKYNPLIINGESVILKGMTLDGYKAKVINDFQTMVNHRVLIAGEQVLNTSISLVAANAQVYFDTDFSYTNFDQSLKRVHRIGQDKPVFTYILLIDESLDVTRNKNLEGKDYINKKFLTKEYVDQQMAKDVFNMKGE